MGLRQFPNTFIETVLSQLNGQKDGAHRDSGDEPESGNIAVSMK